MSKPERGPKPHEPKTMTQPPEWWEAFQAAADAEGKGLAEWVGECCLANLSRAVRRKLPDRTSRGKPKK